ncbi:SDR family NAD(P)-dependent oxidoreductase [Salipiger mangrovisoli]|uniref:SDR family oxidoreductase n=1 Tax=Salipiger mangrovisoli TaxID=2865933 RepID=A0ABR9X5N8_9RHOB|nr:SDR family oxidoreductase [Salipiger mangrovisoli]MBE9638778.1 SDR family oxidoreductase [Salipiger mangrovisoli]
MNINFEGRVALVFGAGSAGEGWSNGKAAAVAYARAGAQVACVDLRRAAAEETAQIIEAEGGRAIALEGDVTDDAQVAAAVAATLRAFGAIDILHNNAGLAQFGGTTDLDLDAWDKAMDVNVKSVFLACRHVIPHMVSRGQGVITNISSLAGIRISEYDMSSYFASKAAVNHLTRAIALRHAAEGLRCNAILPGLINTPLIHANKEMQGHHGSIDKQIAERDAMSPTGKMGDAWDIANASVFLASDGAKYINGVLLPVDGGLSCRVR